VRPGERPAQLGLWIVWMESGSLWTHETTDLPLGAPAARLSARPSV